MKNYAQLLGRVLRHGELREDRTKTGVLSVFGGRLDFDLRERFPLVTLKETRWKVAFLEMLWFLRGEPHTDWLNSQGCKLWDDWADKWGNLGPVYGAQWRCWPAKDGRTVDQLGALIEGLKTDPQGRRHVVSAWNVADLPEMALPPCHWAFQCYASRFGWLDMQVQIRSWDLGLGAPFNIAQYALLLHLIARATGMKPRHLSFCYGDAHIYLNHVDALRGVLEARRPVPDSATLLIKTANTDIDGYSPGDFDIDGYAPGPFVRLPIAV